MSKFNSVMAQCIFLYRGKKLNVLFAFYFISPAINLHFSIVICVLLTYSLEKNLSFHKWNLDQHLEIHRLKGLKNF